MQLLMFKRCRICWADKAITEYYKGRNSGTLMNECKSCFKLRMSLYQRKLASRIKRSQRDKKYRQKPEVVLYQKAYHAARKVKEQT